MEVFANFLWILGSIMTQSYTRLNRTSNVIETTLITGFADGERDEVIAHMAKYGELVEAVEDEASGALVVHFKNRRAAEVAMGKAAHFGEENREANSIEMKLT